MSRVWACWVAIMGLGALWALPSGAAARDAYVVNSIDDDVSVLDTETNSRRGADIALGAGFPFEIAISPDGSRAYILKSSPGPGAVVVIDTANRTRVGADIPVGTGPSGLAVSPDGSRLYVTNAADDDVTVIDTATRARARADIPVGSRPLDVVFSSDGSVAYISHGEDEDVAVIDTATGKRRGADLPSGILPFAGFGITPDGDRLYAHDGFEVASIDVPGYPPPGGPPTPVPPPAAPTLIPGFFNGRGLAIGPDGDEVFLGNSDEESGEKLLSSVETATDTRLPTDVTFAENVYDLALDARGRFAYVTSGPEEAARAVFVVNTSTDTIVGEGIPVGRGARYIAIEPNQPPRARLVARRGAASTAVAGTFTAEVGEEIIFDASSSVDPDGAISQRASWDYGDDSSRPGGLITRHTYRAPGTYDALIQTRDEEGCSTRYISTGQTAHCNGSPVARDIQRVRVVAAPELRLTARRKQRAKRPWIRTSCGELPCEVTVSGEAKIPKRRGKGRRSFVLKQRTRSVAVSQNRLVRLRFERHRKAVRKIRKLLQRKRALKRNRLVVDVEASGTAGGTTSGRKRIKLKR